MSDLKDPRVLFAAERTLLAWNRTSLAMIAFGFVVERAGLLLLVVAPERAQSVKMSLTFWVGLAFILVGALTAFYASVQYARVLRTLNPVEFPAGYNSRWGIAVNAIVGLLAIVLIAALFADRV
jgi:putative membrane protein